MQSPITRILVPVDGSDHSHRAVEYALRLAGPLGAKMVLLHCRRPVPSFLGKPNFQELLDRLAYDAEVLLKEYMDVFGDKGVDIATLVVGAEPDEGILDTAEAEKCELVVMGSRGKGGLEGLIVGSVTHKVITRGTVPVLVVH